MTTNYYLQCKSPGDDGCEGAHLGRSAAGWQFMIKADPSWGQGNALSEWLFMVNAQGFEVVDEYGTKIKRRRFLAMVMAQQSKTKSSVNDAYPITDPNHSWHADGFDFCSSEFS